ncbi:hypothetical protein QJS66_05030 [Kocuria rhizophila]|nr:hypothetical protein QJS66_05030 [Kocuria rhizophila]
MGTPCASASTPGSQWTCLLWPRPGGLLAGTPHRGELVVVVYWAAETGERRWPKASGASHGGGGGSWTSGVRAAAGRRGGATSWWDADEPERALPVRLIRSSPVNAQARGRGR